MIDARRLRILACSGFALAAGMAEAQEDGAEIIPFAGGAFTISAETEDFDRILSYDGIEIARDYVVMFDREVTVSGLPVALFDVGPGGTACGPAVVIVWKPEEGPIGTEAVGAGDCGTPPAAATGDALFFVPYLAPGAAADVVSWSPEEGLKLHGEIAYAPQRGTTWAGFDPDAIGHPFDFFENADIYAEAGILLGDALEEVVMGLSVSSGPEALDSGVLVARGCVPHACGSYDSFVAVDPAGRSLHFAQQQDGEGLAYWPDAAEWPDDLLDAAAVIGEP